MKSDFQSAVAQLRQRPAFVLGASLSLAIGMSLATALFSVIDAALLRPLPYAEPDRLVHLSETVPIGDMSRVPPRFFLTVRAESKSLADVAAYSYSRPAVGPNGEARGLDAAHVTSGFFKALRVAPARGAVFDASDSRSVLIAYSVWASDFGSDPSSIGKPMLVNGQPYTIVGVMPRAFDFPRGTRLWFPLDERTLSADANTRDAMWSPYYALARLAPGASIERADAELALTYARLYVSDPSYRLRSSRAVPLAEYVTGGIREQLRLWAAAAVLVLMLCAVNFATMSLARGMRRRDDIAIRSALGASRGRIVRMLVAEAVLMALLAGALAVLLASWLLSFAGALFADGSLTLALSMSWSSVAFGVLATMVVGFAFALAPAIELAKVDLRAILQSGSTTSTTRGAELRGRRALVALQLGLALTAVAVVTALIRADRRYQASDAQIEYSHLLIGYLEPADTGGVPAPVQPVVDRLVSTPGVSAAAVISGQARATTWADRGEAFGAYRAEVSPGYFAALGVRPIAGRIPMADEISGGAPIVVVARATALRAYGSAEAAVGQRLRLKQSSKPAAAVTIVGVVPDIGGGGLYNLAWSIYAMSDHQAPKYGGVVVIRASGEPQQRVKEMARVLATTDPRLVVRDLRTARAIVEQARGATRGRALFMTTVAVLAIVLAVVGVFSLTSYTTELRARELGIRIALGAGRAHLMRVLVGELWWMAAVGIVAGVLASGRIVAMLDAMFRNPMMSVPLITLPLAPVLASAGTLAAIMVVGTVVPLRRVWRRDVMRAVGGAS